MRRFLRLYLDYVKERQFSKTWADSYAPLTSAHFDAAEGYEKAQLIAEIAIVIASLGVLLSSRAAWLVSIVVAAICVAQLARTYVETRHTVRTTVAVVSQAEEAYKHLRKQHVAANEDEKTVEELDPGGKIRRDIESAANTESKNANPSGSPPPH